MSGERLLVEVPAGLAHRVRTPTPADLVAHVVALPAEDARVLRDALVGTCAWTADDEGTWQAACGAAFTFDDGGPVENGQRYCHSCGSCVVVAPPAALCPTCEGCGAPGGCPACGMVPW
jgi:hypothetical protein